MSKSSEFGVRLSENINFTCYYDHHYGLKASGMFDKEFNELYKF